MGASGGQPPEATRSKFPKFCIHQDARLDLVLRTLVDVRNIGPDDEIIADHQRVVPTKKAGKVCLMLSVTVHSVGFGGFHLPQMPGDPMSQIRMRPSLLFPKCERRSDTFIDVYAYLKKENCKCCEAILGYLGVPDFEYLYIGGIGSWSK